MANQVISIFLPIFFSVLVLCGLILCACMYCQRSTTPSSFAFLQMFSRGSADSDYDSEKQVEVVRRKSKKKKTSKKKKGKPAGLYGIVQTPQYAHVPARPGAGVPSQHIHVHDAEPEYAEEVEVVDAHPDR